MPLQNRVNPFGALFSASARGTFFGNRGGRFHTDAKTLTARRWQSRQWICCVLDFKGRQRDVWGRFYTELFFLDEPTALAAGHRPCFECRRKEAEAFAEAWRTARGLSQRPYAAEMDEVLHRERLQGRAKRLHRRSIDTLPDCLHAGFRPDPASTGNTGVVLRPEPAASGGSPITQPRPSAPRSMSVSRATPVVSGSLVEPTCCTGVHVPPDSW